MEYSVRFLLPPTDADSLDGVTKILTILSEFGYWGEELLGPLVAFDERGYQTVFATPTGKRAHALPPTITSASYCSMSVSRVSSSR